MAAPTAPAAPTAEGGDLLFNACDWYVPHMLFPGRACTDAVQKEAYDAWSKAGFVAYVFGVDAEGRSVALKMTGYKPYFYVRTPEEWTDAKREALASAVDAEASGRNGAPPKVTHVILRRRDMWGFAGGQKTPFIKFRCANARAFNRARACFDKPRRGRGATAEVHARAIEAWLATDRGQCRTYESNFPPLLRLMHDRDLSACGWLRVPAGAFEPNADETTCARNYVARAKDVVPDATITRLAPLRIASFDIECTSEHGDFPQAIKTYRKLAGDLYMDRRRLAALSPEAVVERVLASFARGDVVPKDRAFGIGAQPAAVADVRTRLLRGGAGNSPAAHVFDVLRGGATSRRGLFDLVGGARPMVRLAERYRDMLTADDLAEARASLRARRIPDDDVEADEGRARELDMLGAYVPRLVRKTAGPSAGAAAAGEDDDGEAAASDPDKERALYLINGVLTAVLPELEGDAIINVSTTVHRFGSEGIESRHTAALARDGLAPLADPTVGVAVCRTEREVIEAWVAHVSEVDPCVLSGFNIFGFDWDYIWDRANEVGAREALVTGLTRLTSARAEFKRVWSSSSAMGDNYNKYLAIPGRLSVDLMKHVQRGMQLDSYKLDSVASEFLGENKHDVSPQDIFRMYKGHAPEALKTIAEYCVQDCELVNKLIVKLRVIEGQSQMATVCHVPMSFIFLRGQGIKIFSLVVKTGAALGVVLPTVRPCEVPGCAGRPAFDFPSKWEERSKRRDRRCARCRQPGMTVVLPDRDNDDENYGEEAYGGVDKYEGAIVLDPTPRMYLDEPITVLDYNSLYPSSMISENLCPSTIVLDDGRWGALPGLTYTLIVVEGVTYKFVVPAPDRPETKGVLPIVLERLLQARKDTRKLIEYVALMMRDGRRLVGLPQGPQLLRDVLTGQTFEYAEADVVSRTDAFDPFEKAVLDGRQLGQKTTANSLYGQTGARTSAISMRAIAACTTAVGRSHILKAKAFVETKFGAEVVYGDTDSIFIKFPLGALRGREALVESIRLGQAVERDIVNILKPPQKLAYEKTMLPFIIITKKRYVGLLYETDPDKCKLKYMGLALKRRDQAQITKKVFRKVLDAILYERDVGKGVARLREELDRIQAGNVDVADLVITKTLKAEYKDPTRIAHKVLAERMGERDAGNKPAVNERIPYVYVKHSGGRNVLQGERIESPAYVREKNLPIDYGFYISNQIMVPVSQLLALAVESLPGYRPPAPDAEPWTQDRKLVETQFLLFYPYLQDTPMPGCAARIKADKKERADEANRPPPFPRVRVAADGTWTIRSVDEATLLAEGGPAAGSARDSNILRLLRGVNEALDHFGLVLTNCGNDAVVLSPLALHKALTDRSKVCRGGQEVLDEIDANGLGLHYQREA